MNVRVHRWIVVALLVCAAACALVVLPGCALRPAPRVETPLAVPLAPAAPDLSTPVSAVRAYLDWTSYAYRIANANVATPTMTGDEGVRVDSYVQLNLERKRRIDQHVDQLKTRPAVIHGSRATVGATERWTYRYLSADGTRAISPPYTASYETTYSLVLVRLAGRSVWRVDSVEARALGALK